MINSLGDLATSYRMRRDTVRVRTDLERLTRELSSGVTQDLVGKFKGNFGPLSGIERGIVRMESYRVVIAEHRLVTGSVQAALDNLRVLGDISGALLTVPDGSDPTFATLAGRDALGRFSSALSNLNVQSGGRTVFSGVETDTAAVSGADAFMAALEAEIVLAGALTANDVSTVVQTWFAPGGGFDTVGYLGGVQAGSGPRLSDSETASAPPTAGHPAIRGFLSALAMGGLLGRGVLAANPAEQGRLARLAGEALVVAESGLVDLQAEIGTTEGQLQRAEIEVSSEADALEIARAGLVEADPYETAVGLQTAEAQLQTIYTITARLSRLSLSEYL